ncbi:MAG: YhbY family RNA-binding protein [Deltaproteobacteria bacterium]|nr:YhbY family RNA-binding protein [Deltaproteobacteria bacterium]
MEKLKGFQKKYLRGLAHGMKPVVFIGQKGLTPAICLSAEEALDRHELIKVKFIDFKEKDQKREITCVLENETGSEVVGVIGHAAILYRRQSDPEKRRIELPKSKAAH